jgi:hypothetical protein
MKNMNNKSVYFGEKKIMFFCIVICLLASTIFISGCGGKSYSSIGGTKTLQSQISKEDLREELNKFEDYTVLTIKQTVNKLDELNPDRKTLKTNLIARIRLIQAFHIMTQQDDPVTAFIESWTLSKRVQMYFEEGAGSALYNNNQPVIIEACKQIEAEIENVGKKFLTEDAFHETNKLAGNFARQNPVRETFSNILVYATETVPGQPSPFSQVVALPMAPFKAMEGVDRTASSIYSVSGSMERFTDIVDNLPESTRWQLLLLLSDMEDVELVQKFSDNMTKLSDSSVKISNSTATLPQQLREEAAILVEEIDKKQSNLQVTIDKAQATAVAMEKTLSKTKEVIESAGKTLGDANQALLAWNVAADSTTAALQVIDGWIKMPPSKNDSPKFKITDYKETAQEVTKAAAEIRELLKSNNSGLVDHILWRIAQLTGLIFLLLVVYRLVNMRWISKKINT